VRDAPPWDRVERDLLRALDLTITFFVVGQDAALERNRDAISALARAGHEIGNHTAHHCHADPDGTLRGTGASAGVVRGRARVVLGPEDFDRVLRGDIIVAPASNPGWVPLFSIAAGFVTDTGGVLSHAAVVAREFGLPAVVGTGDGTKRITDGRIVEIDGAAGLVRFV